MGDILDLCGVVRQTGFELHRFLRHGHLEKIYENGLAHRLRKRGLQVEQQHRLRVHDEDGTLLGDLVADLFIEGRLVVELKACESLVDEHLAQVLGYLRACRLEHALLINFGGPRYEIRKLVLDDSTPFHADALPPSSP